MSSNLSIRYASPSYSQKMPKKSVQMAAVAGDLSFRLWHNHRMMKMLPTQQLPVYQDASLALSFLSLHDRDLAFRSFAQVSVR